MAYVKPEEVLSPKDRVKGVLEVIYDPGENQMSVARIVWDKDPAIAVRWNGSDERPLGNPASHGQPTWFVVDDYPADSIELAARQEAQKAPHGLAARYREMAQDIDREREATEWVEGLIGDGTHQAR